MNNDLNIRAVPVERDDLGYWTHPAYPAEWDEGTTEKECSAWYATQGLETSHQYLSAIDEELTDACMEGDFSGFLKYEPIPPDGDGWFLWLIWEDEDGPIFTWARHYTRIEPDNDPWWQGVLWAISNTYRLHADSVAAKDIMKEISGLHQVCRGASEYDVLPLRQDVDQSLPMGSDADYSSFIIQSEDLEHGVILPAEDAFYFRVYGIQGNEQLFLSSFEVSEDAERAASQYRLQVEENKKEGNQDAEKSY